MQGTSKRCSEYMDCLFRSQSQMSEHLLQMAADLHGAPICLYTCAKKEGWLHALKDVVPSDQ